MLILHRYFIFERVNWFVERTKSQSGNRQDLVQIQYKEIEFDTLPFLGIFIPIQFLNSSRHDFKVHGGELL